MSSTVPEQIGLIAGRGTYPLTLARSARDQGVRRVFAIAFRGETDRSIARLADEVRWIYVGQLQAMLDALQASGVHDAVMAGQIRPTNLFRVRPDRRMLELLGRLKERNADTIFGALGDELAAIGIRLLPASSFMESAMPASGILSGRAPDEREQRDIELGRAVAKATSALNIGQTVVIKEGTVLAVEAFEGTDETLKRAGRLGGPGAVVVKVARRGHDMRFDIPVVGLRTLKTLKRIRASALAVEAGRTILLDRDEVLELANRMGLAIVVVAADKE